MTLASVYKQESKEWVGIKNTIQWLIDDQCYSHHRARSVPCLKPSLGRDLRTLLSTVGGSGGVSRRRIAEFRVSVCIVHAWERGRGA